MSKRIVVLGAGFGGLELCTVMSEAVGAELEVTLIDKADAFVFGFSKLDVMFGRSTPQAGRLAYGDISKPGVRVLRETITAIDPEARRVGTDAGVHEADVLVIALGADYDMDATPGLAEVGNEFYSVAGAERVAEIIPTFSWGHVVIGLCGAPFKCPPAPSECALLLHDELTARGVRDACRISFVTPLGRPVPPSPETSEALEREFAERDIAFIGGRRINELDPGRRVAKLDDGSELPFDLFLGVPKHRAPDVVIASGMTEDGYIPVDSATLEDAFSRGLRRGRRGDRGGAQGRRVRRGRGARGGTDADRRAVRRQPARTPSRARHVLHRVRRGTHRQRGHRLPLGSTENRHLQRALGRADGAQGALRLQSPVALVRQLTGEPGMERLATHPVSIFRSRGSVGWGRISCSDTVRAAYGLCAARVRSSSRQTSPGAPGAPRRRAPTARAPLR